MPMGRCGRCGHHKSLYGGTCAGCLGDGASRRRHGDARSKEQEELVVTYTTAPKDYDWFGTETVQDVVGRDKRGRAIRKVRGPANRVEAQRARYASGLHMAVDEPEWQKLVAYKLVTTEPAKHGDTGSRFRSHRSPYGNASARLDPAEMTNQEIEADLRTSPGADRERRLRGELAIRAENKARRTRGVADVRRPSSRR